jgi:hypothetical protein
MKLLFIAGILTLVGFALFVCLSPKSPDERSRANRRRLVPPVDPPGPFETYYFGDGLGHNCTFKLGASGRFSYTRSGCLGLYGRNEGAAQLELGFLDLKPEHSGGASSIPLFFLSVDWGERRYLIPEEEIVEFCNAINQGEEPRDGRHGSFYLRENDWNKPAPGAPELPEPWPGYVLSKPLVGRVLELTGENQGVINLGAKDGIHKDMVLTVHGKTNRGFHLRVIAVADDHAFVKEKYHFVKSSVITTAPPASRGSSDVPVLRRMQEQSGEELKNPRQNVKEDYAVHQEQGGLSHFVNSNWSSPHGDN